MPAAVTDIRTRQALRTKFADLCAPNREDDEKLLRVIRGFEERGKIVTFPSESSEAGDGLTREGGKSETAGAPASSPAPFVSPYLLQPLRSEDEVRALLNRPRPVETQGRFLSFRSMFSKIWGC